MRKPASGSPKPSPRAVRLHHLRIAAAQIETIGEYYRLRARSTRATYVGILCGVLGSAAMIAAFA